MRNPLPFLLLAVLVSFILPMATLNAHSDGVATKIQTMLTGAKEVPPVATAAFGEAMVKLADNGLSLKFRVEVCDIVNVSQAHIHVGAPGTNGPVVLFLYGFGPLFTADGCAKLSSGTLTPSNLIPAGGITWDGFLNALFAGNTYVNVHTTAHPGGEIRGWLNIQGEN